MHLANALIYFTIAGTLVTFQIGAETSSDGQACPPPLRFAIGLVPYVYNELIKIPRALSIPTPLFNAESRNLFRCTITPRQNTADLSPA